VSLHWLWIVPLALLIVYLFSPRFRGDIAETRVRRILAAGLEKNRYTILNDVILPSGGGTTHIDHVVVSRFGIFVIESQYAQGWVSGGEFQEKWKQHRLGRITRLDNPLHRNALQVQALQNLLNIPASKLIPMVVMVGQKGFKTPMPERLLPPEKVIPFLRKKAHQRLEAEQADRVLKAIENRRVSPASLIKEKPWTFLRLLLIIVLLAGVYFAFGDNFKEYAAEISRQKELQQSPDQFHPDGSRKSERELWEESLLCAWSSDTGRCFCYEPGGSRVELDPEKCRSLAERGSILKQ
jgi:hypothetical protein